MGLLALLAACSTDSASTAGTSFAAYAGDPGHLYELRAPAPPGDTADTGASDTAASDTAAPPAPSRWLRVDEASWTLTEGATADVGATVGTWVTRREGGLFVDEIRLLPDPVLAGKAADGATVRAIADWETRYGRFPDAAEIEIAGDGGAWAGTQVFARGVGPVFLTIDGAAWETVWYE
ncbi:MAG: hypothetical protein Q8P18_25660 [Pseudomonadota bacterium]|nr:hypothetical protein [Pseudomonadota bacterium]